ncbi:MAG: hypothetical protein ACRBN8_22850 [Nannocystales bacterium]
MRTRLALLVLAATAISCDSSDKPATDGTLLTPYLQIQSTLAEDKLDNLPELGAALVAASEGKTDKPGVDKIVQGAGRIAAQDIATARSAFKTMSEGMIEFVKADAGKQEGHMLVHCTMTFAGAGAPWVQKSGKVMNPYEGAMMLHCGDKLQWSDEVPSS